jgi:nucleoside phosphorylase
MASSEHPATGVRRHVAVLAPLPLELDAVAAAFGLDPTDGDTRTGRVGASAVTAVRIGMGPGTAAAATTRLLDALASAGTPVDHVMVAGICGGLDPGIDVGTVLFPEWVVDHATGSAYRPAPVGGEPRVGTLVTTAEVHFDADLSRRLLADGALGVDMESAAVARVCEERGRPWSVHRCISDRWVDGLLDPRVVALTDADGSIDLDAIGRLLADEPELLPRLERLGRDSVLAARRAAEDATRACRALDAPPAR